MTGAETVPPDLLDAFERRTSAAILANDLDALDAVVRARPRHAARRRAPACSSGTTRSARSAACAAASRRGRSSGSSTAPLATDAALLVSVSRYAGGGHGPADAAVAADRRPLADHRRPRHAPRAGARPLGVADGRRPALAGRVGGAARRADRRGQGPVRDQGLPRSAPATRPSSTRRGAETDARRRRSRDLLRGGASLRGHRPHRRVRVLHRRRQRALRHPAQRRAARARCPAARRAGRRPRSRPARPTSGSPPTPPARSGCRRRTRASGACARRTGSCRARACCRSRSRSTRSAG